MKRIFFTLVFTIFLVPTASSDQFCADIKTVLINAPTEFSQLKGEAIEINDLPSSLRLFSGTRSISGTTGCTISQQVNDGARYSTGYTCGFNQSNIDLIPESLVAKVGECLGVSQWMQQLDSSGEVQAVIGQYGMIRLSFTQQSDSIGFGFEVFRDEQGEVYGSPLRGNRTMKNGRQLCTPKTEKEIQDFYEMYGTRDGATFFENDKFKGFTNEISSPLVAFITKPNHQAHPAIIVRSVSEEDGSVQTHAGGDFAGDCDAFHMLLDEVRVMNESLGKTD